MNPRVPFDVAAIVPSTRDFLQALATRRKRLALVPVLDCVEDAARLSEFGVAAFAVANAGVTMRAIADASKLPVLCLSPVTHEDDVLAARAYGADAVVIDGLVDPAVFESLAKKARSTRMAVLARAATPESATRTTKLGARAVLVEASSAAEIAAISAILSPPARILSWLHGVEVQGVRDLVGKVDAALVDHDIHASTDFESLQSEVDPG